VGKGGLVVVFLFVFNEFDQLFDVVDESMCLFL
jgi:hypothetical protein